MEGVRVICTQSFYYMSLCYISVLIIVISFLLLITIINYIFTIFTINYIITIFTININETIVS